MFISELVSDLTTGSAYHRPPTGVPGIVIPGTTRYECGFSGHEQIVKVWLDSVIRVQFFGKSQAFSENPKQNWENPVISGIELVTGDQLGINWPSRQVFLQEDPVTQEKYALKQISKRGAERVESLLVDE